VFRGREQRSTEIPVPRIATDARSRILQWLELEAGLPEPDGRAEAEQSLTVGGHEVRHLAPFPDVAVQPQTAIHRVNHPCAARPKFSVIRIRRELVRRFRLDHFGATAAFIRARISLRSLTGWNPFDRGRGRCRRDRAVEHHAL